MSGNMPCVGCWWIENGRCYQDKLADVNGLEKAPRHPLPAGFTQCGLEITDKLLDACVERGFRKSHAAVIGRAISSLQNAGIEVSTRTTKHFINRIR